MKFTQCRAGYTWGRTDWPGPQGPCVCVFGEQEDSQESVLYYDVADARKKTCKGWRVGQGVDATSNSDLRELL